MEDRQPRSEADQGRTVRILRALRACSQLLARADDEQELLTRICNVVVDTGGYRMAWVGLNEHDDGRMVRPVAVAGYEAGYLDNVAVTWADVERGRGPSGTAARTGLPVIIRNVNDDPRFLPWRDAAVDRGYRSVIALPIVMRKQLVGAFTIYAGEPDAFDEEEAQFLHELADDLAYGISSLRDRRERGRMERELADSEGQLRAVFEQSPIGMALLALDGCIVRANQSLATMLGGTIDDLVGRELPVSSESQRAEQQMSQLQELIRGERTLLELEQRWPRPDGEPIWAQVRAFLLRDGQGRPTNVMVHLRDVTDAKRAELALRDSEERFRTLLQTASDPIFVMDTDGRYLLANDAAGTWLGAPDGKAIVGKTCFDLFPPQVAEIHRLGARTVVDMGLPREADALTPTVHGPRWFSTRVSPLKDPDGVARKVLCISRDITPQKEAEAALRTANEMLTGIVNAAPLAIISLDFEGRVVLWKGAAPQLFGWSEDEVLGKPLSIVPPQDRATTVGMLAEVLGGRRFTNVELEWVRKDGKKVSVSLSTAPVRDAEGKAVRVVAMLADLTESKRLEAQLQHAVKMEAVGRLAGGVAHDFNNLIMVVLANAGLILSELPEDHPLRTNVDEIRASAERTAALTKQLLAFSRRQVMQPRVLNLNSVVSDVDRLLRRVLGEDVDVAMHLDPNLGSTFADPDHISQVLMNLVVNARDAMPRGGKLTIETANVEVDAAYAAQHVDARPGSYVKLVVSDSGTGMTAEVREHIFEPFFSTKERGRGTGLGLSTVYGIVRQSSGHISVYTELGRGSTFAVYLPRRDERPEAAVARVPVMPRGNGEMVLLVEDEVGVRSVVQRALERYGYRVTAAASAREGLRLLASLPEPLPLVITDLVMPGMSGNDMAEHIRQHRPEARILFMSGYAERSVAEQGMIQLNAAFLQKPFSLEALLTKVREVLDSQSSREGGVGVRS